MTREKLLESIPVSEPINKIELKVTKTSISGGPGAQISNAMAQY